MRKLFTLSQILLILFIWAQPTLCDEATTECVETTVDTLCETPAEFDAQVVVVCGSLEQYYQKENYSSFMLSDGKRAVRVFVQGNVHLPGHSQVTVTGVFRDNLKKDGTLYKRVIEAETVAAGKI